MCKGIGHRFGSQMACAYSISIWGQCQAVLSKAYGNSLDLCSHEARGERQGGTGYVW